MTINFWTYNALDSEQMAKILRRAEGDIEDLHDVVMPIIQDVKERGDEALIDYAKKFDGAEISGGLKATDEDFKKAYEALDQDIIEAIQFCADNVRVHHEQQMERAEREWIDEVRPGIYAGEKITPIPSVGLYVPRGKGAFPSALYMLAIPAKIAGVENIVICTPPTPDGGFDAATLVAADICGVKDVFKAGGAQAIAAMAYGTQTIPKVVKVEGPGSSYVSAAKRPLSHIIDPGMSAGASDALILADESADPWNTALDLMNEAEHGPDSASVLATDSEVLAKQVLEYMPKIFDDLSPQRKEFCEASFRDYGGVMLCQSMDEVIDFANDYAAEHVLLKVKNPNEVLDKINNAGEILIGETTPMTLGNYGIGVNHVLPTGQKAKTQDCTSVWSFLKRTSISYVTPDGHESLKGSVSTLARYEGFDGHSKVLTDRNADVFADIPLKVLNKDKV